MTPGIGGWSHAVWAESGTGEEIMRFAFILNRIPYFY
jgi:hypothetical protein